MNARKTVLLMSRRSRHRIFREMAADLSRDFRVVVVAADDEMASFSELSGIEVRRYESLDLVLPPTRPRHDIPDLRKTVAAIEAEVRMPVYKAASNCILYGQFVTMHGGRWEYLRTEEEIFEAYAGAYGQLARLFEEVEPSVVFCETIELISMYMALALAVKHGVFALEFLFAPLTEGLMQVVAGLSRKNVILEHLYRHRELIAPESYGRASLLIEGYEADPYASSFAKIHRRRVDGNSPLNPSRLLSALTQVDRLGDYVKDLPRYGRIVANRAWLGRHLSKEIPSGEYIVHFLQHLPEATTYSHAPRWTHPEVVIEQLAINAPSNVKVVVKEHPTTYGTRGREFFEPLQHFPNVVVCHPLVDSRSLLAGARAIVAVTGTVGLEGILLGKPVGVLGRPFYSCYGGVRLLERPQDIYRALAGRSWSREMPAQERHDFIAAYLQSCYEFGHGEGTELWPPRGGEKWAHALRRTLRLLEEYKLTPFDFDMGLENPQEDPP